jgi:hypothetical protein
MIPARMQNLGKTQIIAQPANHRLPEGVSIGALANPKQTRSSSYARACIQPPKVC